jgi:hypothetical protein
VTPSTNLRQYWQDQFTSGIDLDPEKWPQFWSNPINPTSLRLSRDGVKWISMIKKFPQYRLKTAHAVYPKHLLQLEKLLTTPYAIGYGNTLVLIDEATYIMLQLHAGNLAQYLDNLDSQNS